MSLNWQKNAACAEGPNLHMREFFFSSDTAQKYKAKNLCFSCPARRECLKWALENKQIDGIWGGKDEGEIRRALSVGWNGEETRRLRFPQCPYCNARPGKLTTLVVDTPGGGRWLTMKIVKCTSCDFTWRSRTSANAVELFHAQKAEAAVKEAIKKEKLNDKIAKRKAKLADPSQ